MVRRRIRLLLGAGLGAAGLLVAVAAAAPTAGPPHLAAAPRCPLFPASNPWNTRVDRLPAAADSDTIVASVGADRGLHADFGSGMWDGGPIGLPYTVVGGDQKRVRVRFTYADESDSGPYPIPRDVAIEGGRNATGDRHALIVDRARCRLYELYALERRGGGWRAGSGAIWNLTSNRLRPSGWTSADAAGLPILPGLARYPEVRAGAIRHALRFTAPRTRRAYVWPARHYASSSEDAALPPMGLRLRLRAGFPLERLGPQARIVAVALQRYGMMLADNGSPWYVTGAPSPGWDDDDLHTLGLIKGSDLEVVDTTGLRPSGS